MTEHNHKHTDDKAEEKEKKDITKTADFRRFKKLLKQVMKAPPMSRSK